MKLGEISALPATELQRYLHEGSLSAEAVANAVLAQIDRFDPELNAFAIVDRAGVQAAARAADRHRAGNGVLGPFHGLPFSVKDVIQTKGLETAYGSHLMAGNVPGKDMVAVCRL